MILTISTSNKFNVEYMETEIYLQEDNIVYYTKKRKKSNDFFICYKVNKVLIRQI